VVGTLSATDADTAADALTFTTTSADFNIVNGNELRTKRSITAILNLAFLSAIKNLTPLLLAASTITLSAFFGAEKLSFVALEKTDKVIDLTANKSGVSFSITGNDTDGNKFNYPSW
jgi:hypothetical protein